MITVIAIIADKNRTWRENFDVDSFESAEKQINGWIKGFNDNRRHGELERELMAISNAKAFDIYSNEEFYILARKFLKKVYADSNDICGASWSQSNYKTVKKAVENIGKQRSYNRVKKLVTNSPFCDEFQDLLASKLK